MAAIEYVPGTWLVASAAMRRPVSTGDPYPHVHGKWADTVGGRVLLTPKECWCCPAPERRGAR